MRILCLVSLLGLASALAACGSSTSPEVGVESFRMVGDGSALAFDTVTIAASPSAAHTTELTFVGSWGCKSTVIDACTSYTLTLDLDTNAIRTGTPMALDGTTTYTIDPSKGLWAFSFAPAPGSSPGVSDVGVTESCAPCDPPGTERQTFTGQVTISSVWAGNVAGSLHLDLTGKIPNTWEDDSTATLDAVFDVAVQPDK